MMALLINGGKIPPRWVERMEQKIGGPLPLELTSKNGSTSKKKPGVGTDSVRIAFVNNMPDSALEDTEMQFLELLDAVAGSAESDTAVEIKFYSLPKVPRGERGQQHLSAYYHGIEDLFASRHKHEVDALIMTGTEPLQADLRQEPYWRELTDVLDWAERNTHSTILSCLAAHAAVLHADHIPRNPLPDKQFGVFESSQSLDHPLTNHLSWPIRFPHSRWNEVRESDLRAAGYSVLTDSPDAGVDLFVKRKKKSLFVHFQGHPEYSSNTLLKEYRRDIKRFLRQERKTYPNLPQGYFDAASAQLLTEFQRTATASPREEQMARFPESQLAATLKNSWQHSATLIYKNWFDYVIAKKAERVPFVAAARAKPHSSSVLTARHE